MTTTDRPAGSDDSGAADSKDRFAPVDSRVDFVAMENDTLQWWNENDMNARYRAKNEKAKKRFSFIDGPITANNPMGVHHAWGRTYKDLFLRFRNMQGYRQRFQNGFDGQGLWVEVEVEKELGFRNKHDIEDFGIDKFVEECKARVDRFAGIISEQSKRLAMWMDWDDSYHTKSDENNYTIWHFLKTCHERGWIYEGRDTMPWCPRCGTGLSQHEIVTEGYQEITHNSVYLKFPLVDREGESLLVWTTTPWTLAANVAAAVHPENTYVKVRNNDEILYLGKELLKVLKGDHEVLEELPGSKLAGLKYRGPFDELPAQSEASQVHRVLEWDDVGEDEGTGIVHIAPGAGAEDFQLGNEHGLPIIAPLTEDGDYIEGFDWLSGRNVSEVNDDIFKNLEEKGVLYAVVPYLHRYPVCWRCNTELVFRLVDEWFIGMDDLREPMKDATKKMTWVPGFGQDRELDWLDNMHDWMISKKRYWGLALPIYKCESCGKVDVMGSETELKERAVEGWDQFEGHSPHRPWIDAVKIACTDCGEKVSRIPDVGNPWLDAGIVSFSTLKYRTDKDYWNDWYPADWISESFPGQFRNWFYSLIAMSAALENREPAKAVFSYALMRDETGAEMHKSRGNAIWFEEAADKMGVDTMRWLYTRQNPSSNLNFGYGPGDEVRRRFLIPFWNVYSFFVTYANLDDWDPATADDLNVSGERSELDRWLLSELNRLVGRVTEYLETWRPMEAMRTIEEFIDGLSNWYVRRSRRRFWRSESDADKQAAYATLYTALTTLSRLLAPVTPFLSEEMYRNLVARVDADAPDSVHLSDWPVVDESAIDDDLSDSVNLARRLASLGRSARASSRLKVRQPLAELLVDLRTDRERSFLPLIEDQLKEELNVKAVSDARGQGGLLSVSILPNLPALGPKYGRDLQKIRQAIEAADPAELAGTSERGEQITLGDFTLEPDEILIEQSGLEGFAVSVDAGYAAGVRTELTPELEAEGIVRELVHHVQNLRKSAGLEISDRIDLYVEAPDELVAPLRTHEAYVRDETLADSVNYGAAPSGAHAEATDVNGVSANLGVSKSG
ncbi:MAG: isoleucine--tRNA ligase [Chloroflexi bacterium]|nr:isoleucine--tRNA ligase [Chloroflexota bacterium]